MDTGREVTITVMDRMGIMEESLDIGMAEDITVMEGAVEDGRKLRNRL